MMIREPEPFPLKAALAVLRMRQSELGRLMGRSPQTINRWSQGEVAMPRDAQMLVLAMLMLPHVWAADFRACDDPVALVQQLIGERASIR